MRFLGPVGSPQSIWLVVTIRFLCQSRPKTAFCTPFGQFRFICMPFGLCNDPSNFQWMQWMFGDQHCQSLLLYLDYIIVYSSSVEEHLQQLEMVLGWLHKLEKCVFFQREVGYLRHVISSQGISTDPKKIEVAPQPCFRAGLLFRFSQLLSALCRRLCQAGSASASVGG